MTILRTAGAPSPSRWHRVRGGPQGSVIALVTVFCLACGAPQPATGPVDAEGPPQRGGTLQLAASRPPDSLNYYDAAGVNASITLGPVFDTLIEYEFKPGENWQIDFKIAPALAESWQQVDPTTYVFKMRDGVRWHDGTAVTAEDAALSYETIRNPRKPTRPAGLLKDADKIEAVDKGTLRVTTKNPSAEFLALLASAAGGMKIMPKHIADRGLKYEDNPIGTGPFKLESFERLSKSLLVRNPDYWRQGPYLDKIVVIYGLDLSSRLASFITRQTDIINIPDQVQFETARGALPDVQFKAVPGNYGYGIGFKMDQAPFNDIRVRRAMHLAIDRKAMLDTLSFGYGVMNPPAMPAAKTGWAILEQDLLKLPGFRQPKDADIAEAKRLLAEAGFPNGFKTTITMNQGLASTPTITEMLAGQMKTIGVDMTIKGTEPAVFEKIRLEGTYETMMLGSSSMLPDRDLYSYFHSKGGLNTMPIRDARIDELIEAQSRELDVEKRKKLLLDFQYRMLEQVYFAPSIDLGFFAAWQPYVKHYVFNSGAQHYLVEPHTVWMDLQNLPPGR